MANPLNQLGQLAGLGAGGLLGQQQARPGDIQIFQSENALRMRQQMTALQQSQLAAQIERQNREMHRDMLDALRYGMGPRDIYMTPDGPLTRREVENFEWTPDIEKVSIREFLQWETDKWLSKVKMPS